MPRAIDELLRRSVVACAFLASAAAQAAPAHEHGVAQLAAVLEGEALTLAFTLPLDSLFGFERAPRTAAEKQAADKAIAALRRDTDIVRPDPAALCERSDVTLVSAALGLGGTPGAAPPAEEHADIDATYTFRCKQPGKLTQIELPLMAAFPRVARIEAQTVSAKGQGKQSVKRNSPKIVWSR